NIKFKKEKKVTKEEVPKLFELSQESKQSNSPKDFIIKDFIVTDFTNIKPTDNLKKEDMYIKNTENPNIKQSINNQRKQIQNKVPKKTNEEQKIRDYLLDIFPIGKIFNTYIIAESKTDEKVFFIDQHAAHERIMYEKYKKEYEEEEIIVQQLISPEIIEVTNTEISKFKNHMDIFIRLGFDVEEFGSNSIALRGVPLIFGIPSGKTLFLDVLDNIDNINTKINSGYDTKIDKIMKIACTNSIKSGDQINNIEILELFKNLHKCLNPYTCPHGRPTM